MTDFSFLQLNNLAVKSKNCCCSLVRPSLEKALLAELRTQVESLKRNYSEEMSAWENLVATKDADKIEALRATFCPSMTAPLDSYLELEAFIRTFESELSAALSESNALTQIEP